MDKAIKSKIYELLDSIEDDTVLSQVMENVAFYASKRDVIDNLSGEQLEELDAAIKEADNNETISLDEFKKEINGWAKEK